jgi:hypothetical protein
MTTKRRTTREIDEAARKVLREWEEGERKAGRDPDRPGWLATMMDEEPDNPVIAAWWRCHVAAQRYG